VGAIGELIVAADLLKKGYHVFRSCSPSCPCDLAILKDEKLFRVEVKTTQYSRPNSGDSLRKKYEAKGNTFDVFAHVSKDGIYYHGLP
jgi:hypothetical protein